MAPQNSWQILFPVNYIFCEMILNTRSEVYLIDIWFSWFWKKWCNKAKRTITKISKVNNKHAKNMLYFFN